MSPKQMLAIKKLKRKDIHKLSSRRLIDKREAAVNVTVGRPIHRGLTIPHTNHASEGRLYTQWNGIHTHEDRLDKWQCNKFSQCPIAVNSH